MLEVNVDNLKSEIDKISRLIDEYESISMNLFYKLNDSCVNWQDGNSIKFLEKIDNDKKENLLYLDTLNQKKQLYGLIYDKYSQIGKKVCINLNSKGIIVGIINDCCNQINKILYCFDMVKTDFYYPERQNILNQEYNVQELRNNLIQIKDEILRLFDKIASIESEINARIKKIETLGIQNLSFSMNGETYG